jgi:hypothetical protein
MGGFRPPITLRLYGGRLSHKGQRYDVRLDSGEMLVTGSLDPSFDAARALLAKGLTGPFEVRDGITGGLRITYPSVEAAAKLRTVDPEDGSGVTIARWKPFPVARMRPPERLTRLGAALDHPEAPTLPRAVSREDEWDRVK